MTEIPIEVQITKIILDYVSIWKSGKIEKISEDECKWLYLNDVRTNVTVNLIIQCLKKEG